MIKLFKILKYNFKMFRNSKIFRLKSKDILEKILLYKWNKLIMKKLKFLRKKNPYS